MFAEFTFLNKQLFSIKIKEVVCFYPSKEMHNNIFENCIKIETNRNTYYTVREDYEEVKKRLSINKKGE